MRYQYTIKIHTVTDYNQLSDTLNSYGSLGYRVTKVEFIGDSFDKGRPVKKYALYLEKKLKKNI